MEDYLRSVFIFSLQSATLHTTTLTATTTSQWTATSRVTTTCRPSAGPRPLEEPRSDSSQFPSASQWGWFQALKTVRAVDPPRSGAELNTAHLWTEEVLASPWQTCHPGCGDTSGVSPTTGKYKSSNSSFLLILLVKKAPFIRIQTLYW